VSTYAAKQALVTKARANASLIRQLERARQANPHGGLLHFVRHFWSVLEPAQPMVEGRVLNVIAMHLEAVTRGEIRRLLINVSLGSTKSLLVNVFWPLWTWPPPAWQALE
jgi:hypothetical protein